MAPRQAKMPGEEMAKPQHSEEFMKEEHTAKVRQTRMITGEPDISRRIAFSANC